MQVRATGQPTVLLAMVLLCRLQELPACTRIQLACLPDLALPATQTLLQEADKLSRKVMRAAIVAAAVQTYTSVHS